MSKPIVSVILVSYNTESVTLQSVESIIKSQGFKPGEIEIILVDNNSSDETVSSVRKQYPKVKIISNTRNQGYGIANNQGVKKATGEFVLLLNTDAFLLPNSLSLLLSELQADPNLLALAPKLVYPNGQTQQSCGYFPTPMRLKGWLLGLDKLPLLKTLFPTPYHYYDLSRYKGELTPDWVMGACVLLRKADFEAVGGFDSQIFMYAEEVELFLRLKHSFPQKKVKLTTKTSVIHLGSYSSQKEGTSRLLLEFEGILKLYKKHYPSYFGLAKTLIILGVVLRMIIYSFLPTRRQTALEYRQYFAKHSSKVE